MEEDQARGDLLAAWMAEHRVSKLGLAKQLVGPQATKEAVENKRGEVKRWTRAGAGFSDANAAELERILGTPEGYFTSVKPPRKSVETTAERFARLLEEAEARMTQDVVKLRDDLNRAVRRIQALEDEAGGEGRRAKDGRQ